MQDGKKYPKYVTVIIGVALLLAVGLLGVVPRGIWAKPAGYTFTRIASLGDPAPGGEGDADAFFAIDFEPGGINSSSEAVFVADLVDNGGEAIGEGIFLARKGELSQIVRAGQDAPGGGTFEDALVLGPVRLNDGGDVAFAFALTPFTPPLGFNSGVYRFSHSSNEVTPVLVPGVTPAPGGDVFVGTYFRTSINNRGDVGFAGMVPASIGPGASIGLGLGAFRADKRGQITSVARPGDPAPGRGTFDFAIDPYINDGGDVGFDAHVVGEECILPRVIFCATSVYFKKATTGEIRSIAHQGEPAPGGGTYRLAFGPVLNNSGEIVFIGDLTLAPDAGQALGVFLHSKGTTIPVARPGDPMPDSGNLVTASFFISNYHLNNRGDVVFNGILNTDVNGDGVPDTGLFVWSKGSLHLVARTGTVIPDIGTIAHLNPPGVQAPPLQGAALINDHGEVFFQATLADGSGVLLVATPSP
jgi:hypothetical protein